MIDKFQETSEKIRFIAPLLRSLLKIFPRWNRVNINPSKDKEEIDHKIRDVQRVLKDIDESIPRKMIPHKTGLDYKPEHQ